MSLNDIVIKEANPLPVILLVDNSGSMANEKINTVNVALKEMIAEFSNIKNAKGKINIGIISFGNKVKVDQEIEKIENIKVPTFVANGKTWMGEAINKAIEILEDKEKVPERAYTPTIVLLSDGLPSDCPGKMDPLNYNFDEWEPIKRLKNSERIKNCPRLALGIGSDANKKMLSAFIGNKDIPIIKANDIMTITKFFKWVTFSISKRSISNNPNELFVEGPEQIFNDDEIEYFDELSDEEKEILNQL